MRQISSHDLSDSHEGAGLASLFSRPTPPVRRNMNSTWSMLFLALRGREEGREGRGREGGREGRGREGGREGEGREGREKEGREGV